jgi:predicted  nucleic acid-binding Zn-ribbon protein
MKRTISAILLSLIITITLAGLSAAQEPTPPKPRSPRTAQKPELEPSPKPEAPVEAVASGEQMRQTISNLSTQIDALNAEIKLLRRSTERNSMAMESLLSEERLAKLEDKLDQATQRKIELDAREADLQRRQKNIQQEVTARGFLRRDEGETILRTEFQRALDDTHNQQQQAQQRIADLQAQVTQSRARVETLRRRLDRLEGREESSDTKQQ